MVVEFGLKEKHVRNCKFCSFFAVVFFLLGYVMFVCVSILCVLVRVYCVGV